MGLFDRLFGSSTSNEPQPDVRFGRYSDSYKSNDQYDQWDKSVREFENKNYLSAYRSFFQYLKDDQEGNVTIEDKGNRIEFSILQGSKQVFGIADENKVTAESKVVKSDTLNVGFMRRLMEKNFALKYSRFALDKNNDICMKFETFVIDGSPYKLYYGLKELCTKADKEDDLLVDEFDMLHPIETGHTTELSDKEKNTKIKWIRKWITDVFRRVDELDESKFSGGIAYLLLDLAYRLDYLIAPEGFMMESMERIHGSYFARDNRSTEEKNRSLRENLQKILDRSDDQLHKELYRVVATFGITNPVNHDRVAGMIGNKEEGELRNMDWYVKNGYQQVAVSVPGYIAGYCLFNYAVPQPDRELLHLLFEVTQHDYFKDLGFTKNYVTDGKLSEKAIKNEIKSIVSSNKQKFPTVNPDTSSLDYSSLDKFARTFMLMVRNLDYGQKK